VLLRKGGIRGGNGSGLGPQPLKPHKLEDRAPAANARRLRKAVGGDRVAQQRGEGGLVVGGNVADCVASSLLRELQ
jgi:hypothetical protein